MSPTSDRLRRAFDALRTTPRARLAWLAVWLPLALWFARPLWAVPLLPLHDLPNHLGRITALHYVGHPAWNLAPFYRRSLQLVPYLGHFYAVHLLTYVCGSVTAANRLFMIAYVVAAPLCALDFARATGRSPWLALLVLPLTISYFFQWGFIAFCVGCVLLLPALAALFRLYDAPSPRRALAVGLWTALLYTFHVVPWGGLGLVAIVLAPLELSARRVRGPIYAAVAMLPSVGLFAIGYLQARSFGYFGGGPRYEAVEDSPVKLLGRLPSMFTWFQTETLDDWLLIGLVFVLLLLVVTDGHRELDDAVDEPARVRLRVPLAFAVFVALAFATPFWIRKPFNWWMVNQRFFLPVAYLALFFPRGPIRGARALLLGVTLLAMCALPQLATRHWGAWSRQVEPLVALIESTPLGSNTLLIHGPTPKFTDDDMPAEMSLWRELYNYPLVYRGGYDPYLYDDGFPIKRIGQLAAPKVARAAEVIHSPREKEFDPSTMMSGWNYFIVPNDLVGTMPADGAVQERQAGRWTLFRNLNPAR